MWRRLLITTLYAGLLPSIEVNDRMTACVQSFRACRRHVHSIPLTESVCTHPTPRTAGTRLPDPQLCRGAGQLLLDGRVQLGACRAIVPLLAAPPASTSTRSPFDFRRLTNPPTLRQSNPGQLRTADEAAAAERVVGPDQDVRGPPFLRGLRAGRPAGAIMEPGRHLAGRAVRAPRLRPGRHRQGPFFKRTLCIHVSSIVC